MFVLQKKLSVLSVPRSRVGMLYRSGADIQLALPGLPSQMGSAFMVLLKKGGGGKVQVLVGLFLAKSRCNIFYVSDSGEVPLELVEQELAAGQIFAESMGFILNDSQLGRMSAEQQEVYWNALPICQRHGDTLPEIKAADTSFAPSPVSVKSNLLAKRQALREHLGKLLASL